MHATRLLRSLFSFAPLVFFLSCSSPTYRDVYPTLTDGAYDSEFPYKGCSEQLEQISETIHMVTSIAYYKSFPFSAEMRIRLEKIDDMLLAAREGSSSFFNSTSAGSATVIGYENRRVTLLTCAHVVAFQDTIVSYHRDGDGRPTPFVRSISFKTRQVNYVAVLPEGGELQILAIDRAADVAILGREFGVEPKSRIRVFSYPLGAARDLEWGSFVYLFGFPSGHKIVTKGIVSSPRKGPSGSFLVDAVFARGFSGGIALAIRDGVPNFEIVGMVRAVSAHSSYALIPRPEHEVPDYDPTVPYAGEIFVEKRTEIEFGIVQAIPIEVITTFLDHQQASLKRAGYIISQFIGKESSPSD